MSVKNWLKFLFLGLIWGSSFLWIKIALREVGPFTLVMFRVLFAAMGLLFFFVAAHGRLKKEWIPKFLFVGIFNVALPFVLISTAEKSITSGMAAILNSTVPLFTILVAPLFLTEERFTLPRVVGLLLGFGGVIILMSNRLGSGSDSTLTGIAAMLIAALCYAVSGVFVRKKSADIPLESAALGQMLAALCFNLPAALIVDAPFRFPTHFSTYAALLWLGLLGSFVTTLAWYSLLQSVGPTITSMTTYMFPLVGVLLGAIFLSEKMDWHVLAGGALILLAIFIVNSRHYRIKSAPAPGLAEIEGK